MLFSSIICLGSLDQYRIHVGLRYLSLHTYHSECNKTRITAIKFQLPLSQDYSMTPFFIQENYPRSRPVRARGDDLKSLMCLSNAADSLCAGDHVNAAIKMQNWGLLPTQSHFSAIMPSFYMRGGIPGMTNFPQILGQTSKKNRLLFLCFLFLCF